MLHRLSGKRVCLLRVDCGFSDSGFLDCLEKRQMHDVIAQRKNQPPQRALADAQDWWRCMMRQASRCRVLG